MPVRSSGRSLTLVSRSSKSSGFRQSNALALCSHLKNRFSSATWFSQYLASIGRLGRLGVFSVRGRIRQ